MLESYVETKLKQLENYGFKVLKMRTPAYNGTKDRIILWPIWSPGAPIMVECKAPGKSERALQEAVRDDWRARGCDVRDIIDTPERAQYLIDILLVEAVTTTGMPFSELPEHIRKDFIRAGVRQNTLSLK